MKTIINIKADKDVKEQAQITARELGLPLSTLINAYLKQFIRTKEVYLSSAPRMTTALKKIIEQAQRDLAMGNNMSPPFESGKKMDDYLDSASL
ncbi:MAG: hypothetical protein UY09_C0007G0017 [Parcubacteria group bacterium GW2011_GWA2_47_8]|nr:MAG: hypothetical protein UY09_C0007G0017 [Parcubacteria group bacterium GW2011_GWA2_47_8]OHB19670.1 MAG: hypothetical protein A2666_03980 [Parcubacteria group bacterium RIFCSPHIGHO2_01_FULL_47_10b]